MTEVRGLDLPGGGARLVRKPRLLWPLDPATTVVVLAGGLIFVIVAIFVFLCVQGYGTTIEGAKAKAQSATDLVAQNIDLTLDGGLTVLKLAAAMVPDPAGITQAQKATLDKALQSFPAPAQLGFYLPDGSAAAIEVPAGLPASIETLPALAALRSKTDFIVLPQKATAADGEAAIVMVQRLGADTFQGAVLLSIPGSILRSLWATQNLGKDSTININLDTGEMVGRYPPLPTPVSAYNSPNWPTISAADSGTYITTSPIDQVQRVVGFRHIRDLGIVVFATVSLEAAMAGLWSSIIIVSWLIAPIALALLVGSLITARLLRRSARTQANLAKALTSNEVLFREIHHRVKNNLQSVASLFQMQPIPHEVKADMSQRIAAMSAVHEHIYRSDDFAHVRVKQYLQTLIGGIRAGQPNVQVIEDLHDLSVDKDSATPLGLILNEVVSNSFKHAFKDGRAGVVTVHLRQTEDGAGCLTVDDNGVGFDPSVPAKGIGRRLIAALTQQLGGESGFSGSSGGGARFVLSFPLSRPD